jgi:hypothetical protein
MGWAKEDTDLGSQVRNGTVKKDEPFQDSIVA